MSKPKIKLSFIIPCFNEENNISFTIKEIFRALKLCSIRNYELIVIDDGSTDETYAKIKRLKKIRVLKHKKNFGIGAAYKNGVSHSNGEYIIMIPGDNSHPSSSIVPILREMGNSDIIIPFTKKKGERSLIRYLLSKTFTFIMNFYFDSNIKYFNGTVLHKKSILKQIKINSDGFDYQSEVLIKLIKKGFSYKEIEVYINERKEGESKAVSISNGLKIMQNLIKLRKILKKNY